MREGERKKKVEKTVVFTPEKVKKRENGKKTGRPSEMMWQKIPHQKCC